MKKMVKTYTPPPMYGLCQKCFSSNVKLTIQYGIPVCDNCKEQPKK